MILFLKCSFATPSTFACLLPAQRAAGFMLSKRKHLGISCDGEKIKPPSQRDVWNRRHLWWIQTMKNAEGWRMKADGRSKKRRPPRPKGRSALRGTTFIYTQKDASLRCIGRTLSLQSDLPRALSPNRLAAHGRFSLTAARAYSSFSTGTIYVSYYRRFSSDCQPHQRIYCRISIFFASVPRCSAT